MADKPEALRLADSLAAGFSDCGPEAAAELRRLHDETLMLNSAYQSACKIISEQDKKLADLKAVNQELRKALREAALALAHATETMPVVYDDDYNKVSAAIVAAAERAACADICDQHASIEGIAQRCAAEIRARNK
jgi:hypothetical protein